MDTGRLDLVNKKYSAEFDKQSCKSNKGSGSSGAKTSECPKIHPSNIN